MPKIEKSISFERFLYQLEREGVSETEKKNKEYISWNYFKDYLTNYYWKPYTTREIQPNSAKNEEEIIEIPPEILTILKGFQLLF